MQTRFTVMLMALALGWANPLLAQAPATKPAAGPQSAARLAPGTVLGAQLSKGLNAKKAKVGQSVMAKSLGELRDSSGNIIIPRGTKLVGHVTMAKPASKQEPQSSLGLIFDKAEVKQGKESREIGMHAAIQALEEPQRSSMMGGQEPMGTPQGGAPPGGAQPGVGPAGRAPAGMPGASPGAEGGAMSGPAAQGNGRVAPQITANSHGVIGNSKLSLSAQPSPSEGSVISSAHGNVKLESGTLLVLRVVAP